jgi:hypothetical protein
MQPDALFKIANAVAFFAWLILILASPFWKHTDKFLVGIVVTALAIFYAISIFAGFKMDDVEKFSTLDGIMNLFTNKQAVLGGWIHYLCFDLMTGIWIKNNSLKQGISQWLVLPCLIFTFMLGPFGLLLYLLLRFATTKNYFAANH